MVLCSGQSICWTVAVLKPVCLVNGTACGVHIRNVLQAVTVKTRVQQVPGTATLQTDDGGCQPLLP